MTAFTKFNAYTAAVQIVTAAVTSGSVKLLGTYDSDHAANNGKTDAIYLNNLINGIAANLTDPRS